MLNERKKNVDQQLIEQLNQLLEVNPIPPTDLDYPWVVGIKEAKIGVKAIRSDAKDGSHALLVAVFSEEGPIDMAFQIVFAKQGYPVGRNDLQISSAGDMKEWWARILKLPPKGMLTVSIREASPSFESCLSDPARFVWYANMVLHHKYVIIDPHLDSNPAYVGNEHVGVSTYHGVGSLSLATQQLKAKLITHPECLKKLALRALNDEEVVIGETTINDGSNPDYYYVVVNPLASGKIYFQLSVAR